MGPCPPGNLFTTERTANPSRSGWHNLYDIGLSRKNPPTPFIVELEDLVRLLPISEEVLTPEGLHRINTSNPSSNSIIGRPCCATKKNPMKSVKLKVTPTAKPKVFAHTNLSGLETPRFKP